MYKFLGRSGKMYSLESETTVMKLNYNCPDDEKSGTGPGSCGGSKDNNKEYSESITSKIIGFEPTTERTPNGKIGYYAAARTASGNLVRLSNHKGIK